MHRWSLGNWSTSTPSPWIGSWRWIPSSWIRKAAEFSGLDGSEGFWNFWTHDDSWLSDTFRKSGNKAGFEQENWKLVAQLQILWLGHARWASAWPDCEFDQLQVWWRAECEQVGTLPWIYCSCFSVFSCFSPVVQARRGKVQLGNIPSGKRSHNYGTSAFSMGKSTISMAIFNSNVCKSSILVGYFYYKPSILGISFMENPHILGMMGIVPAT